MASKHVCATSHSTPPQAHRLREPPKGYSELVRHMPRWIERKLDFDDDGDPCRMQYWRLSGLTEEIIDVLLDLGLRYESSLLKVRSRWRGHRELPDLLAAVMLHTWR